MFAATPTLNLGPTSVRGTQTEIPIPINPDFPIGTPTLPAHPLEKQIESLRENPKIFLTPRDQLEQTKLQLDRLINALVNFQFDISQSSQLIWDPYPLVSAKRYLLKHTNKLYQQSFPKAPPRLTLTPPHLLKISLNTPSVIYVSIEIPPQAVKHYGAAIGLTALPRHTPHSPIYITLMITPQGIRSYDAVTQPITPPSSVPLIPSYL